jgi:hypothetical protein
MLSILHFKALPFFVIQKFRSALFATLTDDGSGCIDCVGTTDTLAAFNMTTNVSVFLPTIYYLFPNLQHLTFNSLPANTSEQVTIFYERRIKFKPMKWQS